MHTQCVIGNPEGNSSPDSGNQETSSGGDTLDVEMEESQDTKDASSPSEDCDKSFRKRSHEPDVESENDSDVETGRKVKSSDSEEEAEEDEVTPSVLQKEKPKHKWFVVQEVINRSVHNCSFCCSRTHIVRNSIVEPCLQWRRNTSNEKKEPVAHKGKFYL